MDELPNKQISESWVSVSGTRSIREIVERINSHDAAPETVIREGLRLYRYIDGLSEDGLDQDVFLQLNESQIKAAQESSLKFEIALDAQFMEKALKGEVSSPGEHPLQPMYDRLGFYECSEIDRCLGRNFKKPIVHIGSGYPETGIAIYLRFGVPVVCVEKDEKTASKVEQVLKKLKLYGSDKIQIKTAYGQQVTPSADAVIISAMVPTPDKAAIIENMRAIAFGDEDEPLLVLRTSSRPIFSLEYPVLLNNEEIEGWKLRKVGDTKSMLRPSDPIRSQIFRVLPTSSVKAGFDDRPFMRRKSLQGV